MALTSELIRANAAISGLTDEQVQAIVTLSQNDENAVIAKKTGEIYGGLDADILATSGIAKNGTEKTFDYAKRVIGEINERAKAVDGLNVQIAELTKEKARLEKVVADGGADAEARKQLKQAQTDLSAITTQYNALKQEYDDAKSKHASELLGLKINGEFANITSGLKFKADYPQAVLDVITRQAVDKVKAMFPSYVDDGQGGQRLVFKATADGEILRNAQNGLNPFTASELVTKELTDMGVLETPRKQGGAGSKEEQSGGGGGTMTIAGARTRVEASEIITQNLLKRGLVNGSREFQEEFNKAWKENNISALPTTM